MISSLSGGATSLVSVMDTISLDELEATLLQQEEEARGQTDSLSGLAKRSFAHQTGLLVLEVRSLLEALRKAPLCKRETLRLQAQDALGRLQGMNAQAQEQKRHQTGLRAERDSQFGHLDTLLTSKPAGDGPIIDDPEVKTYLENVIAATRIICTVGDVVGGAVHAGVKTVCHMSPGTLRACRKVRKGVSAALGWVGEQIPEGVKKEYQGIGERAADGIAAYGIPRDEAKRFVQNVPGAVFDVLSAGCGVGIGATKVAAYRARKVAEVASFKTHRVTLCSETAYVSFSTMQHGKNALSVHIAYLGANGVPPELAIFGLRTGSSGPLWEALKLFEQMAQEAGVKKLLIQFSPANPRLGEIVKKLEHPRHYKPLTYLGEFPYAHQGCLAAVDEVMVGQVFPTFERLLKAAVEP